MQTIPARQHAEDIEVLERIRRDFNAKGKRAHRARDHVQADDCFANSRMLSRIVSVYRNAQTDGFLPMSFSTADVLDGTVKPIPAICETTPAAANTGSVSIALPRAEWLALTSSLRRNRDCQYQLGRLPWMVIASIEGTLAENACK